MKLNKVNKKQVWLVAGFAVLGLIALQFSVSHLAGSRAQFTVFDAFAPAIGGFLGGIPAIIAVALAEIANFLAHGSQALDAGTIIRFFPILMAVFYFAKKTQWSFVVPLVAIFLFNLNPVGRSVWYFSLFWLIPVVMYFFQDRWVLARALGATFAAHAVGGALWVWFFHLPREVWISLIPVVIIERLLFAAGITVSYLAGMAIKEAWIKRRAVAPAQDF